MGIQDQITGIRYLEQEYLKHKYIRHDENSLESIRTFAAWHSAAAVLFSEFVQEDDRNLIKFVDADTSGNAYVLASVYDNLHTCYEILMAKVMKSIHSETEDTVAVESCPLIFISHSSEDSGLIKSFVDDVLKKGIGLRDEEIACTSFEATGVVPGDSIPEYIRRNIKGSKICLAMVSKNYKSSEVCMNEVGAAWAIGNVPVQIVLPNTDFRELGWLINTDKAAKIDDENSLDNLMELICRKVGRPIVTPLHWNPSKKDFLKSIDAPKTSSDKPNRTESVIQKTVNIIKSTDLQIFDTHFRVRNVSEGEFQTQIDLRLRAGDNTCLKRICLVNKDKIFGNASNERNDISLSGFVQYQLLDIDTTTEEEFQKKLGDLNNSYMKVLDYHIDKNHQISISFVGSFWTIREMDGYMDLPMGGWSLKVEYNVSDVLNIPLDLIMAKGAMNRNFWHSR